MHSLVHRPTLVRIYSGWQYGLSMGDGGRRSRLQFICKNLKNLFYISFNLVNFSFTAYLFCRSLNFFLFSTTEILWKLFIFLFACYQNFSIVIRKRHHLLGWNRKNQQCNFQACCFLRDPKGLNLTPIWKTATKNAAAMTTTKVTYLMEISYFLLRFPQEE